MFMNDPRAGKKQVVIIGAGPAGLTAAYELAKLDGNPIVIEKGDKVGGIARTEAYKGFYFDMGGHRFFTKVEEVNKTWREVLGDNFLRRPRLSRIYYNHKFFDYPLKPMNALAGLGLRQSFLIALSYLRWRLRPYPQEETFEQWVTNRFGRRLFRIFFKSYTEKVWGISCKELKAEWAAQRIKDLSLKTVLLSMIVKPKNTIKTLIDQFDYPQRGPGMMWNAFKNEVEKRGGSVRMNSEVVAIRNGGGKHIQSVVVACNGHREIIHGTDFISSMPVTEFIKKLDPPAPPEVLQAAAKLKYRDFLTVCLIVNQSDLFPDNWIYVHDPAVSVGRIQNFKNWSPYMVPDETKTSLGLEYFCNEGDKLWNMADADLIELGKRELEHIGLASAADIEDGCVFRVPKAYPIYDSEYRDYLAIVKSFVGSLENYQTIGRNGLHRYNNQDHAMVTGMLSVRNIMLGEKNDLWSVNTDQEYHEELRQPEIEPEIAVEKLKEVFARAFAKLDRFALGLSTGMMSGVLLLLATLVLVLKGGDVVGPTLGLLEHYFPWYSVTVPGSLVGFAYGFVTGFIAGWSFAFLRNAAVFFYMALIRRRAERLLLRNFLEYV